MTEETFKKYENLQKRFYKVTAELFFLNEVQSSNPNKKIRDDGWLELTYGNKAHANLEELELFCKNIIPYIKGEI